MPSLLDQRQQQVLGQDLGVPFAVGQLLRREDRFLAFSVYLLMFMTFSLASAPRLVMLATLQLRRKRAVLLVVTGLAAGYARRSRSSRLGLPTGGMPWPFRRKTWPFCVVSGIFRRTLPVIVGTCASPPSTAVVTGTATFVCKIVAFRSNTGCGRSLTRR